MKPIKLFSALILLSALAACTQHPKVSSLAKPTTFIATKDTKKVINKIAELCDREGFQVESTGDNNVVCSRESNIFAQALLGTKYGTNVRSNMRFSVFTVDNKTKIAGNAWMGNQTAFGQSRVHEVEGEAHVILQRIMDTAKNELEKK